MEQIVYILITIGVSLCGKFTKFLSRKDGYDLLYRFLKETQEKHMGHQEVVQLLEETAGL